MTDDNIDKILAYTWGQCTSLLQLVIVGLSKYEDKAATCDVIWLLESLKLATAGIDSKSNKYDYLIEAILMFLTMRQGDTESNDGFLKRFKANAQTPELAGGEHIFCSSQLEGDSLSHNKKKETVEQFMAVHFMK
eukprot:4458361-Ditylum_brightwellii.AAC.1